MTKNKRGNTENRKKKSWVKHLLEVSNRNFKITETNTLKIERKKYNIAIELKYMR